jgi:LysM repeat protein
LHKLFEKLFINFVDNLYCQTHFQKQEGIYMAGGKSGSVGSGNGNKTGNVGGFSGNVGSKTTDKSKTPTAGKISYTVKAGDTFSHISAKMGTNINSLKANNPQVKDINKIHPGDKLSVPAGVKNPNVAGVNNAYTVKKGDTLSQVAQKYNTTVGNLLRANPNAINQRDLVYPGQKLNIPAAGQTNVAAPVKGNLKSKAVNVQLPAKGIGYTSYYNQANKYGTAQTIKNMQDIAKNWNAKHPNDPIQVGDLSKKNGLAFTKGEHKSHKKGVDVDLRPFSKNGKQGPMTIHDKNYNAKLTKELVKDIKRQFPNTTIYFNDKATIGNGTKYWAGHDNHLHLRFH